MAGKALLKVQRTDGKVLLKVLLKVLRSDGRMTAEQTAGKLPIRCELSSVGAE